MCRPRACTCCSSAGGYVLTVLLLWPLIGRHLILPPYAANPLVVWTAGHVIFGYLIGRWWCVAVALGLARLRRGRTRKD